MDRIIGSLYDHNTPRKIWKKPNKYYDKLLLSLGDHRINIKK